MTPTQRYAGVTNRRGWADGVRMAALAGLLLLAACSTTENIEDVSEADQTSVPAAPTPDASAMTEAEEAGGGADVTPTEVGTPAEETSAPGDATQQETVQIAWLTATLAAGYPQGMLEAAEAAAEEVNAELEVFDAQFDPNAQLAQCQDAIAQGTFDAIVVLPAASPVMVPCAEEAAAAGIPLVATNTPIGDDFSVYEPQVEGVTSQVLVPATVAMEAGGQAVVEACADRDPCYIGAVVINRALALSTIQAEVAEQVAEDNDNIELVGVAEGGAQREGGLTAMQDFLQRQPDFDVLFSGSDDMALGAEEAIQSAGLTVGEDVLIVTQGSSVPGIEALREGRWFATTQSNARTEGALPIELAAMAARGEEVPPFVDSSEASGLPQILTPEVLQDNPDFEGTFPA